MLKGFYAKKNHISKNQISLLYVDKIENKNDYRIKKHSYNKRPYIFKIPNFDLYIKKLGGLKGLI